MKRGSLDLLMYKLIATDLDGTLVTDNKKLTKRTIEDIKKAIEINVKIVISSARAFYRLEKYIDELELKRADFYTICFNGGMIVENITGNILYSQNLSTEEVKEIISLGKKLKAPMMLYSKDRNHVEQIPEITLKNSKGINFKTEDFSKINFELEENFIYKIAFIDEPERIKEMKNHIPDMIKSKYEITSSVPEYIEFVKKGIKKSEALKFIMKKYKIKQEEIIAIGDGENDIEMIKYAGLGVAVANADNKVKENSDYITASNNEDGVGKVIEKFLLI